MDKVKVLIDVNSIVLPTGRNYLSGIGRTTLELLMAFRQMRDLPIDLHLYSQRLPDSGIDTYNLPFRELYLPLPGGELAKKLVSKLRLKEWMCRHDLFHIPHNYDVVSSPHKTVLTLHDVLWYACPEEFLGHAYARAHYPDLARKCRAIVTCSQSSKSDMVHYLNVPPEKITVIPWGVSSTLFHPLRENENSANLLVERGIMHPYFLMVSCDIGRKNTLSLMKAFRIYAQRKSASHILVLVWNNPPSSYLLEFAREIACGKICFLNRVDDNLLKHLYNGATASFYPSKYEGFGLPVLESMACGTPVVTTHNSALIEAGGDAAIYADPDCPGQMAEIMSDFELGRIDRVAQSKRCIKHALNFTWRHTASEYVAFYRRVAESD